MPSTYFVCPRPRRRQKPDFSAVSQLKVARLMVGMQPTPPTPRKLMDR